MPAAKPLDTFDALALHRPRDDGARRATRASGPAERRHDLGQVVAVDGLDAPSEGDESSAIGVDVVAEHRRPRLPERVDVDDGDQVVEGAVPGHLGGLPDRALRRLAVTQEHEDARVASGQTRAEREADADAEPLTERARRHIHEGQTRGRMALEIAVDVPERGELLALERAHLRPGRVQHGRGVALAEHKSIARDHAGMVGVQSHLVEEDRRDEIGRRGGARRMSALGHRRRPDRIDPEPRRDVFERLDPGFRQHHHGVAGCAAHMPSTRRPP